MKAVILAAGVGSRIRPLTDHTPKSLLKIGDETILQRMLDSLLDLEIKQIAIVTGYLTDQIREFVKYSYPNLGVTFIRNDLYDKTNTAFSLNLTKNFIGGDNFIKFDADVVFENALLKKLIKNPFENCLCIDRSINLQTEEVRVETDKNGLVLRVGKKLDPKNAAGESIGIEKISAKAGKILFQELKTLLKDPKNFNEYYDDTYTTLVQKGVIFYGVDITGLKWAEIDTSDDYKKAQVLFS